MSAPALRPVARLWHTFAVRRRGFRLLLAAAAVRRVPLPSHPRLGKRGTRQFRLLGAPRSSQRLMSRPVAGMGRLLVALLACSLVALVSAQGPLYTYYQVTGTSSGITSPTTLGVNSGAIGGWIVLSL